MIIQRIIIWSALTGRNDKKMNKKMVKKYFLIIFLNIFLKFLAEGDFLCIRGTEILIRFSQHKGTEAQRFYPFIPVFPRT